MIDRSNGYEAVAEEFALARSPTIGRETVRQWAKSFPVGATVLDLGCGHGVPIAMVLREAGLLVHGIDASPTLVAKFRERFPDAPVECCAVADSGLFERRFAAVVAWGLLSLLAPEEQRALIGKVARVLEAGGRFLFTAPREACSSRDAMTGQPSISLGSDEYVKEMAKHGLAIESNDEDEGGNYYYFGTKR